MNITEYEREFQTTLLQGAELSGKYGFPVIKKTLSFPDSSVPFDKVRNVVGGKEWVHFFINDKSFHSMLKDPLTYLDRFRGRPGIYSPDRSIIVGLPQYRLIDSIGRSREIGALAQRLEFNVLPTIRWGLKETWPFAFDAVEPEGVYAIGTIGCTKNPDLRRIVRDGIPELVRRLSPVGLVVHGPFREDVLEAALEMDIAIKSFPAETSEAKEAKRHGSL